MLDGELTARRLDGRWERALVAPEASLRQVMETLEGAGLQIALVVDTERRLQGTVTDGDIRRALLRGMGMDSPARSFMNPHPVTALLGEPPELWQRLLRRHGLRHLPLLDAEGRVAGLAGLVPAPEPERENLVVLMAGGLGTRLRPLTQDRPKPLLRVGEKPILETIVEGFAACGFRRFVLCINYRGEMIRRHFGDGARWGVEIRYVEEPRALGTAGALSLLPERPREPFFVMNGDILTKVDFVRLLAFHRRTGARATLCVREQHHQIPYGVVEVEGLRVRRLREKPLHRYHINAGIYVLEPEVLDRIPPQTFYDMPALVESLLADGEPVAGFPLREYWIDIGRHEQFEQAHQDFATHFVEAL